MGEGFPAEIVEILHRTGVNGEITQCLCKIVDGPDKGRIKRRNIRGLTRVGDIVMLLNTDMEAKEIRSKRR